MSARHHGESPKLTTHGRAPRLQWHPAKVPTATNETPRAWPLRVGPRWPLAPAIAQRPHDPVRNRKPADPTAPGPHLDLTYPQPLRASAALRWATTRG